MSGTEDGGEAGQDEPSRPLLRIVRGDATPEEIAALVAVLAATSGPAAAAAAPTPSPSPWANPQLAHRRPLPSGADIWRLSGYDRGSRTRADW